MERKRSIRVPPGSPTVTLRIAAPGYRTRTTAYRLRTHKAPKITTR